MGIMIIPTVASLSEDAMSAVPHGLREGAYALGAVQDADLACGSWCPPRSPASSPPSSSAISRAIGETMIVADRGAAQARSFTFNPLNEMQTMTAFIAQAGSGDVPVGSSTTRPSSRSARCCS